MEKIYVRMIDEQFDINNIININDTDGDDDNVSDVNAGEVHDDENNECDVNQHIDAGVSDDSKTEYDPKLLLRC